VNTYSTTTAAQRLAGIGISASTVRNYASDKRITPLLSQEAHPGPGKIRRFSDADLQVIASIYRQQQQGISIADATARTNAGILFEAPTDSSQQQPPPGPGATIEGPGAAQDAPGATQKAEAIPQDAQHAN